MPDHGGADPVHVLGSERAADVTDVLCDAFADYPVMRFVLGEDWNAERLFRLIHTFVMARVLRKEPLLGISGDSGLEAVAVMSDPDGPPSPPTFEELREAMWLDLGAAARARYEAFGAATRPLMVEVPHLHLNMIGVRQVAQGRGLARRLLQRVHRISAEHPRSTGVTLTTENPANVTLYEHFGYEVTGHAVVGPGLETWAMYRPD